MGWGQPWMCRCGMWCVSLGDLGFDKAVGVGDVGARDGRVLRVSLGTRHFAQMSGSKVIAGSPSCPLPLARLHVPLCLLHMHAWLVHL